MKTYSILLFTVIFFAFGCKKNKPLEEPVLVLRNISNTTVQNGSSKDTVLINLKYEIATQALGSIDNPTTVVLRDSRDQTDITYSLPQDIYDNIPDPTQNNIEGQITLKLPATLYLVLTPSKPDGDTLQYKITMLDKDSVASNTVTTENIYIVP